LFIVRSLWKTQIHSVGKTQFKYIKASGINS
jgi:hypothetical protein